MNDRCVDIDDEPPLYFCVDCCRGFTTLHAYNSELHLPCPGRRRNA